MLCRNPLKIARPQRQLVILLVSMEETSKWYSSFMLVPEANGRVILCLDQQHLKKC